MWIAQTGGSGGLNFDPVTLFQYGVLGAVVVALLVGWLRTKPDYERLMAEKDRAIKEKEKAEEQRDALMEVYEEKVIPVLGDFQRTAQALLPTLQQIILLTRGRDGPSQ